MDKGGHHHGVSDDGVSSEEDGGSGESGEEGRGERRRNLRKWAPRKAYKTNALQEAFQQDTVDQGLFVLRYFLHYSI